MVRLNADFPNVIYVLAFDRLVVERNLDDENGIRGRDYLEKIIQVSFDIPEPEPETIFRILFGEMDAVLETLKTRPLDQHRWGNVFHSGFKEHFRTIRHIKRYANGLRLTLAPVGEEVDLVDFLAVELLRVFHPEVYLGVVRGKEMLAPVHQGSSDGVPVERLREWTEALCAKSSPGFQDQVRQLLRELFPELARAYANTTYDGGYHAQWRKNCRVCSPDVFDKFFLLAIPTGEISEVEMAAFVDELGDPAKTSKTIERALASGKGRRVLERLEDFTGDLATEHVEPLLKVMFDLGDQLRFESRGMLDFTADMQVPRIIYQSVRRLESEDDRLKLLLKSVQEGKALYTAVQEASLSEPKSEESEGRLISDHDRWATLRDAALSRIRAANQDGTLWTLEMLPYVLFRWIAWSTEVEVRTAVSARVANDENLVAFVGRFVSESRSHAMGDKVSRAHRKISKKGLGHLLDLDAASARLKQVQFGNTDSASGARELATMIEAKPDGPWDE
jgi:predicted KAP-like P-loop ATPase